MKYLLPIFHLFPVLTSAAERPPNVVIVIVDDMATLASVVMATRISTPKHQRAGNGGE